MLELSRELIGAIALGLFWIHVILIAAAAVTQFRVLGRLAARPVHGGVVRAAHGGGDQLASNTVEQIGRSKGDGVVHFNDSRHRSEVFGGSVELDSGVTLELEPGSALAVWPAPEAQLRAALPTSTDQVEKALVEARRGRGWARAVVVPVTVGDRVFVVDGDDGRPAIVSLLDPRAWWTQKRLLVAGFVVAELTLAAACTVLMLWPPLWDWVSMLGAAAGLGMFLGVQPVGVTVEDAVRTPDRAYLRGRWG